MLVDWLPLAQDSKWSTVTLGLYPVSPLLIDLSKRNQHEGLVVCYCLAERRQQCQDGTTVSGRQKKDFWEHPTFNASFVIHLWCYIPYSWECFIKYQALFKNKFAKLFFCFSFKSKLSFLDNRDSLTSANVLMLIVSKKKHISDKDWAEAAQQIRKHFFKNEARGKWNKDKKTL